MIRTPMDDVLAGGSLGGDGIINSYMKDKGLIRVQLRELTKRTHQRRPVSRVAQMRYMTNPTDKAVAELLFDMEIRDGTE